MSAEKPTRSADSSNNVQSTVSTGDVRGVHQHTDSPMTAGLQDGRGGVIQSVSGRNISGVAQRVEGTGGSVIQSVDGRNISGVSQEVSRGSQDGGSRSGDARRPGGGPDGGDWRPASDLFDYLGDNGPSDKSPFEGAEDPAAALKAWQEKFTKGLEDKTKRITGKNGDTYTQRTYGDGTTFLSSEVDPEGRRTSFIDSPRFGKLVVQGKQGEGITLQLPGGITTTIDHPGKEATRVVDLPGGARAIIKFDEYGNTFMSTKAGRGREVIDNGTPSAEPVSPIDDLDGWLRTPSSRRESSDEPASASSERRGGPETVFSRERGEASSRDAAAGPGGGLSGETNDGEKDGSEKGPVMMDADSFLDGRFSRLKMKGLMKALKKHLENDEPVCLRSDKPTAWIEAQVIAQLRGEVSSASLQNLMVIGENGATTNKYDEKGNPDHEVDEGLALPPEFKDRVNNLIDGGLVADTTFETKIKIKPGEESNEKFTVRQRRALRKSLNAMLKESGLDASHKAVMAEGGVVIDHAHGKGDGLERSKLSTFAQELREKKDPYAGFSPGPERQPQPIA